MNLRLVPDASAVAEAGAAAARAAAGEGLAVRELSEPEDHLRLVAVFDAVWGRAPEQSLSTELLRVIAFDCGYLAGASVVAGPHGGAEEVADDAPGDLVAASIGLFGVTHEGEPILHSHITGALAEGRARHAGFVLKQHQRAWCLARGLGTVQWTYDPLVRRNAYFNAVKLGALPVQYLHDFYGEMTDAINAGHHSDRFLVRWALRSPRAVAAAAGTPATYVAPAGAAAVVHEDADGRPVVDAGVLRAAGSGDVPAVLVGTPADVERMRVEDGGTARSWRAAHRDVVPGLLGSGWRVTGFVDRSSYLLTPHPQTAATGEDPS
ncbi:GNAT family N-acetyltransferase [Kineosporia sp. A_224]|uniref:GNAT family N-acetyltransferase n=1 Tax=Kineosporia sp. A_224 TaxID=1962180 RepID=UPI00117BB73A|nr:GNAT family N-acetyltransferase [Kineosporia sp. A_224]